MELQKLARIIGPTIKWDGYDVDQDNRKIVFNTLSGLQATAHKLGANLHNWAVGFTANGWAFGLDPKVAAKVRGRMKSAQVDLRERIRADLRRGAGPNV